MNKYLIFLGMKGDIGKFQSLTGEYIDIDVSLYDVIAVNLAKFKLYLRISEHRIAPCRNVPIQTYQVYEEQSAERGSPSTVYICKFIPDLPQVDEKWIDENLEMLDGKGFYRSELEPHGLNIGDRFFMLANFLIVPTKYGKTVVDMEL